MPSPIRYDSANLDLTARVINSKVVTGSPALAAETIVCTLPALGDIASLAGVVLIGSVSFTVGTSGVSAAVAIRRTNVAGTVVATTGATNAGAIAAAELATISLTSFDAGPTLPGQVYVLTLTVASGSAASTVSATSLTAIAV